MRRFAFWAVLALYMPLLTAQDLAPDKVIARLEKELKSAKTLEIDFTETYAWTLTGESATLRGQLLLKGDKQFRVETEDQTIVCDSKTVWTYGKAEKRLLIDALGDNEQLMLPRRMLFHMTEDFDVRSGGKAVLDNIDCVHLVFTSKTETTLFPKAEIWVNVKTWLPAQVIQTDLDNNTTTYRLNLIKKNVELPPDLLTFTPPADAEIIDLR